VSEDSALARSLKNTPGECGWVTFKGIRAIAPSEDAAIPPAADELTFMPRRSSRRNQFLGEVWVNERG
jgi:hypothetical protein